MREVIVEGPDATEDREAPRSTASSSVVAQLLPTERGRRARTARLIDRARKRADQGRGERAIHMLENAVGRARSLAPGPERNAILGAALETLGRCELTTRPPSHALGRISEIRALGHEPAGLMREMERRADWDLERDPTQAGPVVELCERARKADRRLGWPHATLGKVAFAAGRYDRAAYCLGHARVLGTIHPQVEFAYHYALGELAFSAKDLVRAAEQLAIAAAVAQEAAGANESWTQRRSRARVREGCARILLANAQPNIEAAELPQQVREQLLAGLECTEDCLSDWPDSAAVCATAAALLCVGRVEEAQRTLEQHPSARQDAGYPYLLALALWRGTARQPDRRKHAEACQRALTLVRGTDDDGADAAHWALCGALELGNGGTEAAIAFLERALGLLPADDSRARLSYLVSQLLGQALFRAGRFDEAAARIDPDTREGALLRARSLHKSGAIGQAVAALDGLCQRYAGDGELLHHYGAVLADAGQVRSARDVLSRAIALGQLAAHRERGHIAMQLGDPLAALADYSAAIAAFPDASDLPSYRLWSLWLTGRQSEARAGLAALLAQKAAADAHLALSLQAMVHEHDGDHARAIAAYEQALRACEHEPVVWGRLCCALARAGQHDAAVARLERALATLGSLERVPPQALLVLGPLVMAARGWALAAAVWQAYLRATAGDPQHAAARAAATEQLCACQEPRVRHALRQADFEHAAELADQALQHAPEHANLWFLYGLSQLKLSRPRQAADALTRAIPGLAATVRTAAESMLALAHAAAGDGDKAQAAIAWRSAPLDPKFQLVLAALLGDWAQVRQVAEQLDVNAALLPFVSAALLHVRDHVGLSQRLAGHPVAPSVLAQQALVRAQSGELPQAMQALREALSIPVDPSATHALRCAIVAIAAAAARAGDWPVLLEASALAEARRIPIEALRPVEASLGALSALYRDDRARAIERWERELAHQPRDARVLHSLLLAHLHVRDQDTSDHERTWRGCVAYGFALVGHEAFWNEWTARRAHEAGMPLGAQQPEELRTWLSDELLIGPLEERERGAASIGERQPWHALVLLVWREKLVTAALRRLPRGAGEVVVPAAGPEYLSRVGMLSLAAQLARSAPDDAIEMPELSARPAFVHSPGELATALLGPDWEAYVLYLLGHSERALQQALQTRDRQGDAGCAKLELVILLSYRQTEADEHAWVQQQRASGPMDAVACARIETLPGRDAPTQESLEVAKRVAAEHGLRLQHGLPAACVQYRLLNPAQAVLTLSLPAELSAAVPIAQPSQSPSGSGLRFLAAAAALDAAKMRVARVEPPHAGSSAAEVARYAAAVSDALDVLCERVPEIGDHPVLAETLRERLESTAIAAVNHLQIARQDQLEDDPLETLDAAVAVLEAANRTPGLARVPPTLAEHYDMLARRAFPAPQDEDTDAQLPALDEGIRWAKKATEVASGTRKYEETLAVFANRRGLVHLLSHRYHDALRDFDLSLQANPQNPIVLAHRGDAHAACERWDVAERDLVEAASLARDEHQHRYVLMRAMHHCRNAGVSRANRVAQRFDGGYAGGDLGRDRAELQRAMQHLRTAREAAQALRATTADIDQQIEQLSLLMRRSATYFR